MSQKSRAGSSLVSRKVVSGKLVSGKVVSAKAVCCALVALAGQAALLMACGSDAEFDYTPPTDAQLEEVQRAWSERDLAPRGIALVYEDDGHEAYQLRIYEHLVDGRRHYGAVTIPKADTESGFPVVLFADGLDQFDPTMDISLWAQRLQHLLGQGVFVMPVFRGRTLIYRATEPGAEGATPSELTFEAEGDFCDAFDGATDDAIALLNVTAVEVPRADFSRLMAKGQSRGGNTALLLGERDERVTVVSATAAPTDFYRQEVYDHYSEQYRCQFLTGKTEDQSRTRMLASSPLRFQMKPSVEKVYIDHGEQDSVVPLWNALDMVAELEAQQVEVQFNPYPGHGHTDLRGAPDYLPFHDEKYSTFLAP